MLTREQTRILGVFGRDRSARLTFRQVKEGSRQKSNNIVQTALGEFARRGLVRMEEVGDVKAYSLNPYSAQATAYLNLLNEEGMGRRKLPLDVLEEIRKKLLRQTEFFILIVFGSYAKGKATERSDLDVAVIVDSEQAKKDAVPGLETVKRRELVRLDYHVFTRAEFLEMLAAEYENVGKQIHGSGVVYHGFAEYYNLTGRIGNGRGG